MKRTRRQLQARNVFDLIEEATQLLRAAPISVLALYYLGAFPFVFGALYFWGDMSRSPLASDHLAGASLGMAALFFWQKFWQAVFARRLRALVSGRELPRLDWRGCGRILLGQAIIQPWGLFLLPLSIVPVLPFPWVCAFFQNAAVLASEAATVPELGKKAWKQSCLWPSQNTLLLGILLVFGLVIDANWEMACRFVPELLKMFLGIESDFTRSPFATANSTFAAGMAGLTYLCVDPIMKTAYVLRCFYGESLASGEDLKAQLAPYAGASARLAGVAALISLCLVAPVRAAPDAAADAAPPAAAPATKPSATPAELDELIDETIHEQKYMWRMPRDTVVKSEADENIIVRFVRQMGMVIRQWIHGFFHWLHKIWRWLFPDKNVHQPDASGTGYGWIMSLELLLYGLGAAVAIALAIFLTRVFLRRRQPPPVLSSIPLQVLPDLADENVRADQLPEDEWSRLARELLERGEFRLAMRALYFASLSHLAGRNLISIARFKSNRDYERELRRRAHSLPEMLALFGDNLSVFERIWYGMHEANGDLVRQFAANLERIKAA